MVRLWTLHLPTAFFSLTLRFALLAQSYSRSKALVSLTLDLTRTADP